MSTKPIIVPVIVDDKTGQAFIQLNDKILQMKARTSETMNHVRSETEKARASIALLGEDIGVKIPRHLQTLIAESELARGALTAAFGGIALVAFIDVLEKVPEAINKVTDALAGWTKEAQEAYKVQIELNKEAISTQEKVEASLRESQLVGLDGSKLYLEKQKQITDQVKELNEQLGVQQRRLAELQTQAQQTTTVTVTNGPYGGSRDITAPTEAAEKAKAILESDDGKALVKSTAELADKIRELGGNAQVAGAELHKAFKDEGEQAAKDFIDSVLTGWKQINEQAKANQQLDKDAAAMMKAMASDAKQITNVLNAPVTQVRTMQQVAEQITRALEAEKAQEQELAAASKVAGDTQLQAEQRLEPLRAKTAKDLQETVDYYKALAAAGKDPALIENAKKLEAQLDTLKIKAQTLAQVMKTDVKTQFEGAFTDMILQTKSVADAFKQMAASIIADLVKMILEMYVFKAVSGLLGGLFGGSSGNGVVAALPGGGTSFGAIDMSGLAPRAGGGPVDAGVPYLVGENGPEPFIPSTSGTIIPSGKLGGNTYNIDARGSSAGVERDIMRAIKASEDRAVVRSVRTLDSRAKRRG